MRQFLERQKSLLDYTLAALLRRKTRTLGLLLVYSLLVFLLASILLLTQGLRREAALLLQDAPEVMVQRQTAGRHDFLPIIWLESLRQIRGVRAAQGRLWGYYYDPVIQANYTLMAAPEREKQWWRCIVPRTCCTPSRASPTPVASCSSDRILRI